MKNEAISLPLLCFGERCFTFKYREPSPKMLSVVYSRFAFVYPEFFDNKTLQLNVISPFFDQKQIYSWRQDPHSFFADPDPAVSLNANPDPAAF